MTHIKPFKAVVPQAAKIKNSTEFFKEVKNDFRYYLNKGFYAQDGSDAFFIHRVQTKFRSYTGIITLTHLETYEKGKMHRHEHTIKSKEEHVQGLYESRQGLIKPVMLTYPNVLEIDALVNRITFSLKPAFEFQYDDEYHTFWRIDQEEYISRISELFVKKVPRSYIADGHHRTYTSMAQYEKLRSENSNHTGDEWYCYMLAEYLPASEIEIHNYNRLLTSLGDLTADEFISGLSEYFDIEQVLQSFKPISHHQMGMYMNGKWYKLLMKPSFAATRKGITANLDVQIFNEVVLHNVLKIKDVREFKDIAYSEGPKGTNAITKMVNAGGAVVGFLLYPVPLESMIALADRGGVLPPKSTWFYPRLRSGFIAQIF